MNRILSRLAPFGALAIVLAGCDVVPVIGPSHENAAASKSYELSGTLSDIRRGVGTLKGLEALDRNNVDPAFQEIVRSLDSVRGNQPAIRQSGSVSSDLVAEPSILPAPDLIWYSETGSATIWKMNGATFSGEGATVLQIPKPWRLSAVGDMNADTHPDFIYEDEVGGTKAVVFMVGPAYGGSVAMMIQIPIAWRIAAAADMNGDGKTDLIIENTTTGDHIALFMNGAVYSGSQAPLQKMGVEWKLAAVADVNGDGKFDLIWENKTDGTRTVSMYNGTTYTGVTQTVGVFPVAWKIGAAGDFNGDGQADVVMQNSTDGQRRIYFMQGAALTAQYAVLPSVTTVINVIGAARINWNPSGDKTVSDVAGLRTAVASAGPNSRVLMAAGVYDLGNTPLRIIDKTNFQLLGAGRGQTILKGGAAAPFIIELAGSNSNFSIAHFTLEGATTLQTNTHALASGDNVSITKARIFDLEIRNTAVGISVDNSQTGACTDVEIVGNYLDNIQDFPNPILGGTSGSGYGIHNEGCVDIRIADNVIRNADRHSIYQAKANQGDRPGFGKIVIEHNLIIDHAKTSSLDKIWLIALVVARSSNVVVANNIIVNPYHIAMSIENEAIGDPNYWNVTDVRLINNVVIGPREMDIYLAASGPFTFWGNRFYHRDATGPSAPVVVQAGYGASGSLVEPSALTGTQALAAAPPFAQTFAARSGVIQRLTTTYNTDPSTWPLANSPFLVNNVEDLAASPSVAYVVAGRKLTEINPLTWAHRDGPITFPASSMLGYADGNLAVVSNGQIYRLNPTTLDGAPAALPGSGPVRGMAMFGDKTYILSGSCTYEIKTSDLTTASSVC